MEISRRTLSAFCLFAAMSTTNAVSLRAAARSSLRVASEERVQLIAQAKFTAETVLRLPAHVTEAQQANVLSSLESQVQKLQSNVDSISKLDKAEHTKEAEAKNKDLRSHMKGADQAMLDKMDDWGKRMNRKTRLGAMDVLSKLKNAIHLVKKGALSGNKDSANALTDVLGKMGAMAGQPTGGNFLH